MLFWRFVWPVIWFVVSLIAVYMSWTCPSNKNQKTFIRILFAIFAYIFGIFYISANIALKFCKT
jgi:lipopolysaccharide export LptBFGC system permease protein LptF